LSPVRAHKQDSRFDDLASLTFLFEFRDQRDCPLPQLIKEEAYDEVLKFDVAPWTMPTEKQLEA
jgi:hypothetical protein